MEEIAANQRGAGGGASGAVLLAAEPSVVRLCRCALLHTCSHQAPSTTAIGLTGTRWPLPDPTNGGGSVRQTDRRVISAFKSRRRSKAILLAKLPRLLKRNLRGILTA